MGLFEGIEEDEVGRSHLSGWGTMAAVTVD
jgi:hypothetical protein